MKAPCSYRPDLRACELEERLPPATPRPAIGAGLGAPGLEPAPDAMGDQPAHGGATGRVGGEDLAEEDPEGYQRGEDPVLPGRLDLPGCLSEALLGEDVGRGELAVSEEFPAEGLDLPPETMVRGMSRRTGSALVMGVRDPSIRASTPRSAYRAPGEPLTEIDAPFLDYAEAARNRGAVELRAHPYE